MVPLLVRTAPASTGAPVALQGHVPRKSHRLKLRADRPARVEDHGRAPLSLPGEFTETLKERGKDEAHGPCSAAGKQQHGSAGVVAHGGLVVGGHEGMPHKVDLEPRVGVAPHFEGENDREGVQVARHVEAALRP